MSAPLSVRRLARLHDLMAGHVEAGRAPGVVTGVSRGGEIHTDAVGSRALDGLSGATAVSTTVGEMTRDSIFRISSMTKPLTAVAAMTLIEDGVLHLDDPVDEFIPELADRQVVTSLGAEVTDTVPAARPITVRDLLMFTAGYGQFMAAPGTYPIQNAMDDAIGPAGPPLPSSDLTMDDWIARLGTVPLAHQPGAQWMYNTSADIMGVLIARASGQPFENYLQEKLFGPLGMTDTAFQAPAGSAGHLTASYLTEADGSLSLFDPAVDGAWSRPPGMALGAAGLLSTVDDLLTFGRMMLDGLRSACTAGGDRTGGAGRILGRPFVELMTTDQLSPAQKAASTWVPGFFDLFGWGLGLAVITARQTVMSVGTFGWDGGLGTSMYMDPHEDLVGVLLTQAAWTSPMPPTIRDDFWTGAYGAIDD